MDELNKRRQLMSDPQNYLNNLSEEERANLSSLEVESLKAERAFQQSLRKAYEIDVDEAIAEKIILNQQLSSRKSKLRYLSMAASLVLVLMASLLIPTDGLSDLSAQALAHVELEEEYLTIDHHVSLSNVDQSTRQMGLALPNLKGPIQLALKCKLGKKPAMHIITNLEDNPVSLLITEHQGDNLQRSGNEEIESFSDKKRFGKTFSRNSTQLFVIAENMALVDRFIAQLDEG